MNANRMVVLIGVGLLVTCLHANADSPGSSDDGVEGYEAVERDAEEGLIARVRMLEIPSYEAFFGLPQDCTAYTGIYVVERQVTAEGEEAVGRVVEVIRGPPRETARLGPIAERLKATRLMVYLDEHGVPSDESPIEQRMLRSMRLREVILRAPSRQPRELAAIGQGVSLPMNCFPHPEDHPRSPHTRAMVRYWTNVDLDVQEVFDLLSSEELPEVWAACDMRLGGWPRDRIEDWDRIGDFLSQALGVDGVVQQRLDRPPLQVTGNWVQDNVTRDRHRLSGDMKSLGCHVGLLRALRVALLTVPGEPTWRQDALRVLVDAANHESEIIRNSGCSIPGRGLDLGCDADKVPNPTLLHRVRSSLGMPSEPRERTMWHDRDIHPDRHLFPGGLGVVPDLTREEEFPGEWDYFFANLQMRGYAVETSIDGRTIAVPIGVDAPVIELLPESPRRNPQSRPLIPTTDEDDGSKP